MIQQRYRIERLHLALNDFNLAPYGTPYREQFRACISVIFYSQGFARIFSRDIIIREIRLYLRSVRSLVNGKWRELDRRLKLSSGFRFVFSPQI